MLEVEEVGREGKVTEIRYEYSVVRGQFWTVRNR